jgi:hypothetical protein
MSKYLIFDDLTFADEACLLAALAELGYPEAVVERGEALPLYGYHGDRRPETAALVVRRVHLTGASNDLGFAHRPDGAYVAIVSEYDERALARKHGESPGATFTAKLRAAYDWVAAREFARRKERQLRRVVTVQREIVGHTQRVTVGW